MTLDAVGSSGDNYYKKNDNFDTTAGGYGTYLSYQQPTSLYSDNSDVKLTPEQRDISLFS